jgi:hypothetical protein
MSLATLSLLSPMLPDAIMQVSRESEQNLSVSCLNHLPLAKLAFSDNNYIQDSGSGLFANVQNVLINGGIFIVGLSCELYKQLIVVHILSSRTIIVFYPPILKKGM